MGLSLTWNSSHQVSGHCLQGHLSVWFGLRIRLSCAGRGRRQSAGCLPGDLVRPRLPKAPQSLQYQHTLGDGALPQRLELASRTPAFLSEANQETNPSPRVSPHRTQARTFLAVIKSTL